MRMLCIIFSTVGWIWAATVLVLILVFGRRRVVIGAPEVRGFPPVTKQEGDHS